ncbi:transposase, partial [Baia soyae]
FKSKVVQEAQEMGSAVQVAKRYEITANLIYRWKKEFQLSTWKHAESDSKRAESYIPSSKEFLDLEKENVKLKEILGDKDLEIAVLRDLVKKGSPAYRTKWK